MKIQHCALNTFSIIMFLMNLLGFAVQFGYNDIVTSRMTFQFSVGLSADDVEIDLCATYHRAISSLSHFDAFGQVLMKIHMRFGVLLNLQKLS